jgi:hypothetical protein
MSYREKTAWLALVAMVITYGPYFTVVGLDLIAVDPLPSLRQLGLFATTAIVQMLILAVGHLYLRRSMADEARCPPDERDRAISYRARNFSYYVLISGMILVGCVLPFTAAGWSIVNAALFMIVAAELVGYGLIVVSYRKQS